MHASEDLRAAARLLDELRAWTRGEGTLSAAEIPLSAVAEVVRRSLEDAPFFPAGIGPEDLGDGVLIERRSDRKFIVWERFETGQMRYSPLRSRAYRSLCPAVARYLAHYARALESKGVKIRRWV